ncbi:MAG TPA: DNA repair protein RecN [Eubacteriaceae bacterium]|nr:DNA repair protein RecN [Eubacteriaceae bacterium]
MLAELNIQNYALIDNTAVSFRNGLNVITGETGAGKSILIGALLLCLGNRGSKDVIRSGADKLTVQALFTMEQEEPILRNKLETLGLGWEGELILTRELHRSGRNVCRINGLLVNVGDLKEVGAHLVDIHSQREHNALLHKANHLSILDEFIGSTIRSHKESMLQHYLQYQQVKSEKKQLLKTIAEMEQLNDVYTFQMEEIDKTPFEIGEDSEIEQRIKLLSSSEIIFKKANEIYEKLYAQESSVVEQLGVVKEDLKILSDIDASLADKGLVLEEALANIEDLAYSIRDYKEEQTFDEGELAQLQSKAVALNQLKRKYGPELEDVLETRQSLELKREQLEQKDELVRELDQKREAAYQKYMLEAKAVSKMRKEKARAFDRIIQKECRDLKMEETTFSTSIHSEEKEETMKASGIDEVEFMISTNRGEEQKPLTKIVSGGEISRLMLAIKNTSVHGQNDFCMIFDEIDSGISGSAAFAVGKKLKDVSAQTQVIAITHLPQVASMGDAHYKVEKTNRSGKTQTALKLLSEEERVEAIATMTDGNITDKSMEHAQEMIKRSQ